MSLALILRNWKLVLSGLLLLVIVGLWLAFKHEKREAGEQRQRAKAAQAQAQVNGNAAAAVDRYHTQTTIIREKADAAVEHVQDQPGAASPVPADLLSAWRDGIGQLRKPAEGGDADHSGEPEG